MDANDIVREEIDGGTWDFDVVMRARDLGMKFGDDRDVAIAKLTVKLAEDETLVRELKTNESRKPKPLGTGPNHSTEKDYRDYYATINAAYKRIHDLKGEIEKVACRTS